MSRLRSRVSFLGLSLLACASATAAPFTPGNLVVYRVGDGSAVAGGVAAPVFLDEFTPAGAPVQSIALPVADSGANQTLTNTTNGTSTGYMTRSADGNFLVVIGYDAAVGTASINSSTSAAVNRIVGRIAANATIDTSTRLDASFSGDNVRGAASVDGSAFWISGTASPAASGGVWYATLGALGGTQIVSTPTNLRTLAIYNNQLYVSSGAGAFRLATVGSGLPTTAGQTITNLPGYATATEGPYQFFFADLDAGVAGVDTVYVANDDATALKKWSLVAGSWTSNGVVGTDNDYRGLTGTVSGSTVTLHATRTVAGVSQLVSLVDASGYNGAFAGTPSLLASGVTNTVFRGVALAPAAAVVTPALSIGDLSLPEGNTGTCATTSFNFPVTASVAPASTLTFSFSTVDGSAISGPGGAGDPDFTAVTGGTGTIAAGNTTGIATVLVNCDDAFEPAPQDFVVNLNAGAGYTIADGNATGSIGNDDAAPISLSIQDRSVVEGQATGLGACVTTELEFFVTASSAPASTLNFSFNTTDGTAISVAGGAGDPDFTAVVAGSGSITAGNTTGFASVFVNCDDADEPAPQDFTVNLVAGPGYTIGDGTATGSIVNDDAPLGPTLSIANVTQFEGDATGVGACVTTSFDFQVTASAAPPATLNFAFSTVDGTALSSGSGGGDPDYIGVVAGTGSIAVGNTTGIATVLVNCDDFDEFSPQDFSVNLQPGMGYTIGDGNARGLILNDDAPTPLNLTIADVSANEGNSGTSTFTFTVQLSAPAEGAGVEFDIETSSATATSGVDFVARQIIDQSIPAGQSSFAFAVTVNGDLRNEANETFNVDISNVTGLNGGTLDAQAVGTITNDDVAARTIAEIQGNGSLSTLLGTQTTVGNVVTAVINNTPTSNGFFIQMPSPGDNNPFTSDAVLVFTGATLPTVVPGDVVDVRGTVVEFATGSPPPTAKLTEFSNAGLIVNLVGAGATLPAAVTFDATTPSPSSATPSCVGAGSTIATTDIVANQNFECYESMRITTTTGVVTAPNQAFGTDPLAEMYMTTGGGARAQREPGIRYDVAGEIPPTLTPAAPPLPASPIWDGNPEVFELDVDKLGQPSAVLVPGTKFSATGVLGYEFSGYEFFVSSLTVNQAAPALPVPVPARGGDQLTVASLNLLRLFNDVNDPGSYDDCAMPGNSDVCPTTQRFTDNLAKRSAYIRTVLLTPMVIGLSEVENLATAQALATRLNADLTGTFTYTALMGADDDNDPGHINNAFLVRNDVTVDATAQFRTADTFVFNGAVAGLVFDRPPFVLRATTNVGGTPFSFAVIANHLRSLGGIDVITPLATQQDAHRVRQKRLRGAALLADIIQTFQAANPTVPLFVTGDMNAFEFTDGYADITGIVRGEADPAVNEYDLGFDDVATGAGPNGNIVTPPLVQALLALPATERYSFTFGGSAQVLDHGFMSQAAAQRFEGVAYGRGNTDAPVLYNSDFTAANLPLRSSDHDAFVIYVNAANRPTDNGFELFKDGFE